jgi:DNA-binding transcriptional ArsR family regulator
MRSAGGDVFQAIASPVRRDLLDLLRPGELPVRELASRFDASRPAISQHLAVLRSAGLVEERTIGRSNLYWLTPEPLLVVDDWVSHYERFWRDRMGALRRVLDAREAASRGEVSR